MDEQDLRFKEADIVRLIKDKEHMFGDLGLSTLIFEKAIMRGATIMDCLIATENKGVIGIEIKTERDSTQRLNKQVENYSKVCDLVYVMCHDSHVAKVEKILKNKKYTHVGIIAYIQIGTEPWVGIYKEATHSPLKDVFYTLDILWKVELSNLLGSFSRIARKVESAHEDQTASHYQLRSGGIKGVLEQPLVGRRMNKSTIIHALIGRLGQAGANRMFCDYWIHGHKHVDKIIKLEHFNPKSEQ